MRENVDSEFQLFMQRAKPRLRRALVAAYGAERGREATAEALAYAWEHWENVGTMANATGYLYRVGQSMTRERRCAVGGSATPDSQSSPTTTLPPYGPTLC